MTNPASKKDKNQCQNNNKIGHFLEQNFEPPSHSELQAFMRNQLVSQALAHQQIYNGIIAKLNDQYPSSFLQENNANQNTNQFKSHQFQKASMNVTTSANADPTV